VKVGLAALRITVGGLFVGHGLQKLTGNFGGGGLTATGEAFESMGLRPGRAHAAAAGGGEAVGGALLAGGLLTPLGASLISGTMVTAIRKVHAANGPWASKGGYEYNLVLLAIVFAVTDVGPGELSLDHALGIRRSGLGWALAQLGAGLIGSAAAITIGARVPVQPPVFAAESSSNGASEHHGAATSVGTQASAASDE
jgi:putative oxidoreductase